MPPTEIFLLVLGAACGGFVNGLAGFGTALFTLGIWLQFMQPQAAVAIVAVMSFVTGLQGLWEVRANLRPQAHRFFRLLIPALIGLPLGVWALHWLDATALKLLIAGFLLLYGVFFGFRAKLPAIGGEWRKLDVGVGFLGGVLGGAASLSGALPTMWCALRGWPKTETRAVLQPFNVTVLGGTAVLLFLTQNLFTAEVGFALAIALPVGLLAARAGILVFRRLENEAFRRLLIWLMLVSGVLLALREISTLI